LINNQTLVGHTIVPNKVEIAIYMKKYLAITLLSIVFAIGIIAPAFAQQDLLTQVGSAGLQIKTGLTLPGIIALIINVILTLLGVLFLVLTVYAGFLWMTAQGDSKQVDRAKDILKQAIIGLIIVLAAYAIANFVATSLIGALAT
jgi:uncharacterized membrane protein